METATRDAATRAVLRLTLLGLVLQPAGPVSVRVPVLLLAGLGLLSRRVLLAPLTWLGLAGLTALRVVADWPLADNHVYLIGYWCLAIGLGLRGPDAPASLGASGRLLVGLAFAFAVLWKGFLSPDYTDGRFFRITLLTDQRFEKAAMLLGRLTAGQLQENRQALQPLPDGVDLVDPPELTEPPAFARLAAVATWGVLALEGVVAVAFLAPLPAAAEAIRHAALLLFSGTTYAFAPVAGFGFVLLAMGLAQCRPEARIWRGLYLVTFGLVLCYREIPWARLLLELVVG